MHVPSYLTAVKSAPEVAVRHRPRAGHRRQPDLLRHARGQRAGVRRLVAGGAGDRRGPRRPRGEHRRRPAPRHGRPGRRVLRLQRLRGRDLLAARPRVRPHRLHRCRRPPRRRRAGGVLQRSPGAHRLAAPAPDDAVAGHRLAGGVRRGRRRRVRGQRPAPAGHQRRRLAARLPRDRAVAARRVPTADPRHPVRCRHPRRGSAGQPGAVGRRAPRRSTAILRELAGEFAGGKWLAVGGGGYGLFRVVPRSWTHLVATVLDRDVEPNRPLPADWVAHTAGLTRQPLPDRDDRRPGSPATSRGPRAPTGSTRPSSRSAARSSRCTASTRTTPGTDMELVDRDDRTTRPPTPPAGDGPATDHRTPDRTTRGTGRPTCWPRTAHRAPAPHPAQRRRRAGALAREPLRPHPLPALLRPLPADLAAPSWSGSPSSTTTRGSRFICLLGDEIIAVGRYEGMPGDGGPGGTTGTPTIDSAEVAFVARDDAPGSRAGLDPARTPRGRGPGERAAPVRGRGARGEPPDGAGLPAGRLPGQPGVRRGRGAPRVRHRPHRALAGGPRRPRATRGGPQRPQRAAPHARSR